MNINLKFLLLGTSLSLIPNITNAQCSPAQSCAELGYKENANKGSCLKCPFGNSWYCPCDASYQYTCIGANEQPGTDKCGNKYKSCTCVSGYEWKDGKCEKEIQPILGQCTGYAKNCKIGDILNSDGTCTNDVVSDKKPIGVVVFTPQNKCGWAMTASPIATDIKWSKVNVNTGAFQSQNWQDAIRDDDLYSNMTKIIQSGNSSQYPAAYAALNYAPNAAPTTKGKWVLPTANIFSILHNNLYIVNSTISKLGGTPLTDDESVWSSTECSSYCAWASCINTYSGACKSGIIDWGKNNILSVRPVIEF